VQDETGQYATTDQADPSLPSPYLDASGAAPQAYLAPPQPDLPKYGDPPEYRSRLKTGGPGSLPYVGPGNGRQPGDGQPSFGPAGSSTVGGATRRDPALAAPWERLAASFADWIIIWILAAVPFSSPLLRLIREYREIGANYQHLNSPAVQAAANHVISDSWIQLRLYWPLVFVVVALAYYWVQHAVWGATLGKRAVGIRVVTSADHGRIGVRAAGVRAAAFIIGPAMLWLWSLTGPVNMVGGALWTADAGFALLDPRAQCLHDKLAGTLVMKKRWLDQQARSTDS